ncbi:mCG1045692, partial [Mus musculus]
PFVCRIGTQPPAASRGPRVPARVTQAGQKGCWIPLELRLETDVICVWERKPSPGVLEPKDAVRQAFTH